MEEKEAEEVEEEVEEEAAEEVMETMGILVADENGRQGGVTGAELIGCIFS